MASNLRGIPISPLTGPMDLRSAPDQLGPGSLRFRQNLQTVAQGKLRRGSGWTKLLTSATYNNEDHHDQLLTFIPNGIRQPVTLLFEAESTRGTRSLIAGRQSSISELDEFSGNWRILGSGYGGAATTSASAPRFKAAQVGDYLAVTNDYDKPMYHLLEANPISPSPLLQTFSDLDTIGLSRAAVVWSWHDCIFFADVVMDGERFGYRFVWSDFKNPLGFDPANLQSITGFRDLFTYEKILAGRPFGSSFLIYTTHGIWEMLAVGGEQSFDVSRRYNGEDAKGTSVLKYPNTLSNTPSAHVYLAEDGIYEFNPFYGAPRRPEWAHRASGSSDNTNVLGLFDNIDSTNCQVHVAIYQDNEYLISTAPKGASNQCPTRSLRLNSAYDVADIVDFGFTAFVSYRSYKVPTIRDFILTYGICDLDGLIALGYGFNNEGLPLQIPISTQPFTPDAIYTNVPQTIDGVTTEDWNQPAASEHSLCTLLGDTTLDTFCHKCEGDTLLVGAASNDWCLKQIGDVFFRERCVNPTAVGAGLSFIVAQQVTDGSILSVGVNSSNPLDAQLSLGFLQTGVLAVSVGDNLFMFFDGVFIGPVYTVVNTAGTLIVHDPDHEGNRFDFTSAGSGYASAVGSYLLDGYDSILRFAPMYVQDDREAMVKLSAIFLYYFPRIDPKVGLRVGIGAQPVDPNNDNCDLRWFQHSLQDLGCLSTKELAQMESGGTIPDKNTKWRLYRKGKVICIELKISGTGSDLDLTAVVADVSRVGTARF